MTLKQRREVVRKFKAAWRVLGIAQNHNVMTHEIEQVLRDYINGKFTLKAKRKIDIEYVVGCAACERTKRKARSRA